MHLFGLPVSTIAIIPEVIDFITDPLYIGSACLGLALFAAGMAGRISKKHEFPANTSAVAKVRAILKQPHWLVVVLLIGAALLIGGGNVLIRRAGIKDAREREERAQEIYKHVLAAVNPKTTPTAAEDTAADSKTTAREPPDPYEQWAEDFWTNRGNVVVNDIDLGHLNAEEFRTAMSLRWWSVLESARNTIERGITKYNERAPTKALLKLQPVPRKFVSRYTTTLGTIEFGSDVSWEVKVLLRTPLNTVEGPELDIDIPRGRLGAKESAGSLYVKFFNSGEFEFKNYIYGLARSPKIADKKYSMDKFEDVFRNAVLELIKAQTLLLDAAAPE